MIDNSRNSFYLRLTCISLFLSIFGLFGLELGTTANAQAQKSRPKAATSLNEPTTAQRPVYGDYKGVRIGMTTNETRAILGQPAQSADDQDFYVISQTETAQVVYDTAHKVAAISIDYLGDKSGAPDYKEVVGTIIDVKPNGSMYKMVRYEQLGFWVSYNRTAGAAPIVTVTIQKNQWAR